MSDFGLRAILTNKRIPAKAIPAWNVHCLAVPVWRGLLLCALLLCGIVGYLIGLFIWPVSPLQAASLAQDATTTLLIPGVIGAVEATPAASGELAVADDGQVYGLLGILTPATNQPFSTYLVAANDVTVGLLGATPAVEAQIVALRGDTGGTGAKVWGTYQPRANAGNVPQIVVSDILAAELDDQPQAPSGQTGPVAVIQFDLVNLRTGPGTRFPPSGQATLNQVCDIIGRNELETWYLIDCLGGDTGWMDVRMVTVNGDTSLVPVVDGVTSEAQPLATPTPLPVQTPAATPLPPSDYWAATFYNNSQLSGDAVLNASTADINFNWGTGSPHPSVSPGLFSGRFERTITFTPGYYRFLVQADDGVRLYLDDQLLIDEWHGATGRTYAVGRYLTDRHVLRVDYYNAGGIASIRAWYEYLGNSPEWQARYYGGIDLAGVPMFEQPEASSAARPLDYDWGQSSPLPGAIAADFWSGRWVGTFRFETGNYVFRAVADDGVRLYLNDTLVIDQWMDGATDVSNRFLGVGADEHTITVEFYERTGNAALQIWWYREATEQLTP